MTAIAPGGSCSGCHLPHKANQGLLWSRDLSGYTGATGLKLDGSTYPLNYLQPPTIQCYDCHDYHGGGGINNVPAIGGFAAGHKPQNIAFGFKKVPPGYGTMTEDGPAGTFSGYYENQPPYDNAGANYGADPSLNPSDNADLLKTGGHYFKHNDPTGSSDDQDIGDKLSCRLCHDPHAYDSSWQAFIRRSWPPGSRVWTRLQSPWNGQASEFMANQAASGSRNNRWSRELCIACHGSSSESTSPVAPVYFYEIDSSFRSGLVEVVRPPDGIDEHRQEDDTACVSCHKHSAVEANCAQCHFYPGKTGGIQETSTHRKHVNESPSGLEYKCKMCHTNYNHNGSGVTSTEDWGTNFDRAYVNVNFDPSWNPSGLYDNTHQCSALYCHGDSLTQANWGGSNPTPSWENGATAPCGSCHGTGAAMRTTNHPVHLDNAAYPYGPNTLDNASCANGTACHTAYGFGPGSTHVDRIKSLRTSPSNNTAVGLSATQVCVNCHSGAVVSPFEDRASNSFTGDNLARTYWDNSAQNRKLPCFTCHNNTVSQQGTTGIDGSGRRAPNIAIYWAVTGHGASLIDNAATTTDSGTVDQVPPVRCETCHDTAAAHFGPGKDTVNPWRLLASSNFDNSAGGQFDMFCNRRCHSNPAGTDPVPPADHACNVAAEPAACVPDLDPSQKVKEPGDTHWTSWTVEPSGYANHQTPDNTMPLHGAMTNRGFDPSGSQTFLCVTCHDPHGIGSAAAEPRSFTGVIHSSLPAAVNMLRYNYEEGLPVGDNTPTYKLCWKCHVGGR